MRKATFTVPSGHSVTIREQNGEDEDILSNPVDVQNLMNLSKFISAIVVDTDITENHKLTVEQSVSLPLLDRYCILINSRIFSLGETLHIKYKWDKDNEAEYEEDLSNYLYDYAINPSVNEEVLNNTKPNAVPYYPSNDTIYNNVHSLSSGKVISFECLTGKSEQFLLNLPQDRRTRNAELVARNLKLNVDGNFEKVTNFSMFTVKDMAEIRNLVQTYDPVFEGITELENPKTGETINFPIFASPDFFFLTEA